MRPCLFANQELDLREALRNGRASVVREALAQMIAAKPERHPLDHGFVLLKRAMSEIGG